jgi:Cu/Ag efflux protein CusF
MCMFSALLVLSLLTPGVPGQGQQPNAVTRESTTTAKVDRIERSSRVVTLRTADNVYTSVYVEPAIKAYDTLKVGDVVTVRYTESVIVQVRPEAKPSPVTDTTNEARKAGDENILEQQKIVVTIDNIDSQGLSVSYRTHDNQRRMYAVRDKKLLDGLKAGDRVEITLTRARAVSIEAAR